MFDTIQKLKYRANAGIAQAQAELAERLGDRVGLPLPGLRQYLQCRQYRCPKY